MATLWKVKSIKEKVDASHKSPFIGL
jgi:hypothetical protein